MNRHDYIHRTIAEAASRRQRPPVAYDKLRAALRRQEREAWAILMFGLGFIALGLWLLL